MADLPSTPLIKINDIEIANDAPVTNDVMRKIGIDLNALIDRQGVTYQDFTANGTFVVPANVNHVWVLGCGGGGGGGGGTGSNLGGGGGGAGAVPTLVHTLVTPSASIPITIGTGGSGSSTGVNGVNGASSSFGSLLSFDGGKGGAGSDGGTTSALGGSGSATGRGFKTFGGNAWAVTVGVAAQNGDSSFFSSGGLGGAIGIISGGGGGAGLGAGGNGGTYSGTILSATNGSGYGSGGGGGGSSGNVNNQTGANGANGYIRVIYANS
jgi:hypothetical protein